MEAIWSQLRDIRREADEFDDRSSGPYIDRLLPMFNRPRRRSKFNFEKWTKKS